MPLDSNKTEWIVQINENRMPMPSREQQPWEKWSIYRVPAHVTDHNRVAYQPLAVSFGPYHYGEDHLLPMEEHKNRVLLHFLARSGKPLERFLLSLRELAGDLEASYIALDPKWKEDGGEGTVRRFLRLMITDGCFMLEILRFATYKFHDYGPNDPIFSNYGTVYIMQHIRRDMLVLEDQLPMLVLDRLVAVESDGQQDDEIMYRHKKSLLNRVEKPKNFSHVLDEGSQKIIRSAAELNYAGIQFKKSETNSLRDISYARGVLRLPVIEVDDTTESVFLNRIAFERLHIGAGHKVTSYVSFMDNIIANERDVELLQTQGIIHNAIRSDKAVAELLHSLSKDVALDPESSLDVVLSRLKRHCEKPRIMWRSKLVRTYFSNPWAILSLLAAVFALALTIIQTAYTVLSYSPNPQFASLK